MPENYGERHEKDENLENQEQKAEREKWEKPDHFEKRYKLKPNETYEAGEGKYEYKTDKQGRITECNGTLKLCPETERNNYAQLKAGGEDRRPGDEGGHLIARRFGGSKEIDNMVALDGSLNKNEYKKMEDSWEKTLKEKDEDGEQKYDVDVHIVCEYKDKNESTGKKDSQRPSDVNVYATTKDAKTGEAVDQQLYHYHNNEGTMNHQNKTIKK